MQKKFQGDVANASRAINTENVANVFAGFLFFIFCNVDLCTRLNVPFGEIKFQLQDLVGFA